MYIRAFFLPVGVCGTGDNCFVEMPFTGIQSRFIPPMPPSRSIPGSGITMYVFNAGLSGMTASFSIDGGTAVSNTTQAPPPPTYQVSNVSLYSIQGLPTGNHTMTMTVLDWSGSATSMKFDYAYINETFMETPATTSSTSSMTSTSASQTPTQTSAGDASTSNKSGLSFTPLNAQLTSCFRLVSILEPLSGGRWEAWPSLPALCLAFFTCVNARQHARTSLLQNQPSKSTRSHQNSAVPLHLPHNQGHSLPSTTNRVHPFPRSRVPPSSATPSQSATTPPGRTRVHTLSGLDRARPSSNRSAGNPRTA